MHITDLWARCPPDPVANAKRSGPLLRNSPIAFADIELWAPLTKEACIVRVALLGFDHLGQLLAQLWAIVVTMHRDSVLHCRVYKLLLVSAEIATVQFISFG